jgi:thioredoxin-like negative regulator of GroEL
MIHFNKYYFNLCLEGVLMIKKIGVLTLLASLAQGVHATEGAQLNVIKDIISEEEIVLRSDQSITVIDAYATWCEPCQLMQPTLTTIAQEFKETCSFARVDIDKVPTFLKKYNIKALPTCLVLKGEKVLGRIVGNVNIQEFRTRLSSLISMPEDLSQLDKAVLNDKLFEAIQQLSPRETEELIKAGANVNTPDKGGITPLFAALIAVMKHPDDAGLEVISQLLDAGCSKEVLAPGATKATPVKVIIQGFLDQYTRSLEIFKKIAQKLEESPSTTRCTDTACRVE